MKQILIYLSISCFLLFSFSLANAKNYYFSTVSGNDSRTSTEAQNMLTPWKTLSKLNSFFGSLNPGDSVLFRSGEVFYGSLTITKSGSESLPIVFASYGEGNRPIISSLQALTNWVSIGDGIYESNNTLLGNSVNILMLNGSEQPMGRYPNIDDENKGYLTFESHTMNSITDNQFASSINWTGAEVIVRPERWVLDRSKIIAQAGHTLSFTPSLTYDGYDNFGYFIQNHIKTLDKFGEWYYNPSTKKMNVYFGDNDPDSYNIKASTINTLVTVKNQDNIVFYGLCFKGANEKAFDLYYAQNIQIQHCSVVYSGIDGITGSSATDLSVSNTYFNFNNNSAIDLDYNCNYSSIRYNYIANTAIIPGMGQGGNGTYQGITINGNNNLIEYNTVYNTGYAAIRFGGGDSIIIKNNFINYFNLSKDDGGGIYTGSMNDSGYFGQKIIGNIILNGMGVPEGTDRPGSQFSSGIDLDDNASNIEILSNTVSNCGLNGILIHNSYKITIKDNILYNNSTQLNLTHDYAMPDALLRNNIIKNNILFSKLDTQLVSSVRTEADDINLLGVMDSNYYCRPIDDNLVITSSCAIAGKRVDRYHDLSNWKATYNLDKSSKKTPIQIPAYIINDFVGSNKFSNGTFNTSITGLYTSPISTWLSNKLDGGTFQAITTLPSTYSVVLGIGAVSSSKKYILRFSSQALRDTILNIFLRLSDEPYTRLSDIKLVPIKTSRTENEYLFSFPASSSSASIIFECKAQAETFWLDNIQLYEANVSDTSPDDYIIFEYNASQSDKTVSLPAGTYVDVYNKIYTNNIVIPPYSSVILVKQTTENMPVSFLDNIYDNRKNYLKLADSY